MCGEGAIGESYQYWRRSYWRRGVWPWVCSVISPGYYLRASKTNRLARNSPCRPCDRRSLPWLQAAPRWSRSWREDRTRLRPGFCRSQSGKGSAHSCDMRRASEMSRVESFARDPDFAIGGPCGSCARVLYHWHCYQSERPARQGMRAHYGPARWRARLPRVERTQPHAAVQEALQRGSLHDRVVPGHVVVAQTAPSTHKRGRRHARSGNN